MLPSCYRTLYIPKTKYLPLRNRGMPVPRNPTTIGGHLRRRRLELRIFQPEAARRLGVSTVTLSRWECDKLFPNEPYRDQIVAFLGFDPFTEGARTAPSGSGATNQVALPCCDEPSNERHAG